MPNISFGPVIVDAVRRSIVEPERYLDAFAKTEADHLLIQAELASTIHLHGVLSRIHELGKKTGAVLDPANPSAFVEHVLHLCKIVVVMTVNGGFGDNENTFVGGFHLRDEHAGHV